MHACSLVKWALTHCDCKLIILYYHTSTIVWEKFNAKKNFVAGVTRQKLNDRNIFNNEQKGNVFIHWRLQETKLFYHEQISHKISNSEFFPNYGITVMLYVVRCVD